MDRVFLSWSREYVDGGVAGARWCPDLHIVMSLYRDKTIDKAHDVSESFLKVFIKSEGHTSRVIAHIVHERVCMTGQFYGRLYIHSLTLYMNSSGYVT